MIFQLFYKSTSIKEITPEDIDNIVFTSIERNSNKNITGCLVYFKGEFYQLLEGDKKEVLQLYDNIKKDNRHNHVTLIDEEISKHRVFSNWNMALYYINEKRNSNNVINDFKNKILLLNSLNFSTDTSLEFWYDIRKKISSDDSLELVV